MQVTIPKSRVAVLLGDRLRPALLLILGGGLSVSFGVAQTQSKPPADPPSARADKKPSEPQPAPAPEPSLADRFPFPGEAPGTAAPAAPNSGGEDRSGSAQPVPASPAPAGKQTEFPFPGEPSSSAPDYSSSSSSSRGDESPADSIPEKPAPDGTHEPLTRTQRRHLPKVEDLDHREAEDVEVSRYYFSTGDFRAAYLRAQDAIKIIPDDPEAHFALAQSAEKLKKLDEAVSEYKAYLTLDPDGTKAKAARRALAGSK